jgi:hypothetical protein
VALLGIGSYFGIRAIGDHRTAVDRCPTASCADLEGVRANESSQNEAELSTAGFALGGAAMGVAALLYFTSGEQAAPPGPSPARKANLRWQLGWTPHGPLGAVSADW